jgi:hypothetical protein
MSARQRSSISVNRHIQSLQSQLGEGDRVSARQALVIVAANPHLDRAAIDCLRQADVLLLSLSSTALSETLERQLLADTVVWAVEQVCVTSLTLVRQSQAVVALPEGIAQPGGPADWTRRHNDGVDMPKLQLKNDVSWFLGHSQLQPLLIDRRLSVQALFYLQESRTFLQLDLKSGEFRSLI